MDPQSPPTPTCQFPCQPPKSARTSPIRLSPLQVPLRGPMKCSKRVWFQRQRTSNLTTLRTARKSSVSTSKPIFVARGWRNLWTKECLRTDLSGLCTVIYRNIIILCEIIYQHSCLSFLFPFLSGSGFITRAYG